MEIRIQIWKKMKDIESYIINKENFSRWEILKVSFYESVCGKQ